MSKLGVFGATVELQEEKDKIAEAQGKVTAQVVASSPVAPDEAPLEALNKPVDQDFKQAFLVLSVSLFKYYQLLVGSS